MNLLRVIIPLVLCLVMSDATLRVCCWNLQRFGVTKMGRPEVVDVIVKFTRKCDLIIFQEVQNSDQSVPPALLGKINDGSSNTYVMAKSDRVGETSYKEQYIAYFREDKILLHQNYTWDNESMLFKMDPYSAHFEHIETKRQFGIISLHANLHNVTNETDHLADVYDLFVSTTGVEDVLILGDLNTDCSYFSQSDQLKSRLFTEIIKFKELIDDYEDTTTKSTDCAYDRIFAAGSWMQAAVITSSAKAEKIEKDSTIMDATANPYLLTNVSDHYPVCVEFLTEFTTVNIDMKLTYNIEANDASVTNLGTQCEAPENGNCGTSPSVTSAGSILIVDFVSADKSSSDSLLDHLLENHPLIFNNQMVNVLKTVGGGTVFNPVAVNGGVTLTGVFKTNIFCNGIECSVTVGAETS